MLSRSLLSATHTHLLPLKRVARPLHTSCLRFSDAASSGGNQVEVINVQDENDFKVRVLESKTPVIVDFHAT